MDALSRALTEKASTMEHLEYVAALQLKKMRCYYIPYQQIETLSKSVGEKSRHEMLVPYRDTSARTTTRKDFVLAYGAPLMLITDQETCFTAKKLMSSAQNMEFDIL